MAANIGRELREICAALAECRGDLVAEPRITAAALAHLLLCSRELLMNLLIDTARRPSVPSRKYRIELGTPENARSPAAQLVSVIKRR